MGLGWKEVDPPGGIYKWVPDEKKKEGPKPRVVGKNKAGDPIYEQQPADTGTLDYDAGPTVPFTGVYCYRDRQTMKNWLTTNEKAWNAGVAKSRKEIADRKSKAEKEKEAAEAQKIENEAARIIKENWDKIQAQNWPKGRPFQRLGWPAYLKASQTARKMGGPKPGNDYAYWAATGGYGVDPVDVVGYFTAVPYSGSKTATNSTSTYPLSGKGAVDRLYLSTEMVLEPVSPKTVGEFLWQNVPVIPGTEWTVWPKNYVRSPIGLRMFSREYGKTEKMPSLDASFHILSGKTEVFWRRTWDIDAGKKVGNIGGAGVEIGKYSIEGQLFKKTFAPGKYTLQFRVGGHVSKRLTRTITFTP